MYDYLESNCLKLINRIKFSHKAQPSSEGFPEGFLDQRFLALV